MEEIYCTICGEWLLDADWEEAEVSCKSCGEHYVPKCPKCGTVFDEPIDGYLPRRHRHA